MDVTIRAPVENMLLVRNRHKPPTPAHADVHTCLSRCINDWYEPTAFGWNKRELSSRRRVFRDPSLEDDLGLHYLDLVRAPGREEVDERCRPSPRAPVGVVVEQICAIG